MSPASIASKLFHSRQEALGRADPEPLLPRLPPAGFSWGGWSGEPRVKARGRGGRGGEEGGTEKERTHGGE